MTIKNYIFTISTICIFAGIAYANLSQQKGRKMRSTRQTQANQALDFKAFTKTPSGIAYQILKQGSGNKLHKGETAIVDYTGWLLTNDNKTASQHFDSSFNPGRTEFEFPLGQGHVISGWDQTVADMKIGEKRLVIIPSNLGYGMRGAGATIPPNSTLVFEIDLYGAR